MCTRNSRAPGRQGGRFRSTHRLHTVWMPASRGLALLRQGGERLLKETPEAFAFARRLQRPEANCLEALMEALNERGECEKRAPEHRVTCASGGRRRPHYPRLSSSPLPGNCRLWIGGCAAPGWQLRAVLLPLLPLKRASRGSRPQPPGGGRCVLLSSGRQAPEPQPRGPQ